MKLTSILLLATLCVGCSSTRIGTVLYCPVDVACSLQSVPFTAPPAVPAPKPAASGVSA
jgi:hypothetical protein